MKKDISVLVVDDNVEFCDLLRQYINRCENMKAVGVAKDGIEGVELIRSLHPDVVILDIIMPNLDGIGVLEKVNEMKMNPRPVFVVLSAVGQDVFTRKAMDLGAEYYMVKPFDIDILLNRVKETYNEKHKNAILHCGISTKKVDERGLNRERDQNVEMEVTSLMHEVGIPAHLSGYRYLREAIILATKNANVFNSVTRILYPSIAERFNSTPQKVERSIRNAIEATWTKETRGLKKIFDGEVSDYWEDKPTNSQFIAVMAEKIRINLNARKNKNSLDKGK